MLVCGRYKFGQLKSNVISVPWLKYSHHINKYGVAVTVQAGRIYHASSFCNSACCCTRSSYKRCQLFFRIIFYTDEFVNKQRIWASSAVGGSPIIVTSSTAATSRDAQAILTPNDLSGRGGSGTRRMDKPGFLFLSQVGALPAHVKPIPFVHLWGTYCALAVMSS